MTSRTIPRRARRAALISSTLAFSAFVPSRARAETEPTVTYDAPAACPSESVFVNAVRGRTRAGTLVSRGPSTLTKLAVKVAPSKKAWAATLVVTDAAGRTATRRLTASSCSEAAEGVALVAALTLDPYAPQASAAGATSVTGADAKGGADVSTTDRQSSSKDPEGGSEANDTAEKPAEGAPGDAKPEGANEEEDGKPEAKDEAATLEESPQAKDPTSDQFPKLPLKPAEEAPAVPRKGALPSHFSASLSAMELSGPLPTVIPGLELAGEGRIELTTVFDLAVRAGLRLSAGTVVDTPQGDARFEWFAFAAGVCPGAHTTTDVLSLALCALVEQGQTHASGERTTSARDERRNWTAFGPGLRGRWAIVPRASLELAADALVPTTRDTFSLGSLTVHEAQAVAFRLAAGVAFRFQ